MNLQCFCALLLRSVGIGSYIIPKVGFIKIYMYIHMVIYMYIFSKYS